MKKIESAPRALALALAVACTGAAANSYTIVDLGPKVIPSGVDARGAVSGTLEWEYHRRVGGHKTRAVTFSEGKWREEAPRHEMTTAAAISKGRVAGNVGYRPAIWVNHGQPQGLALPDGATSGTATGINSAGDVTGYYDTAAGQGCFVWSFATKTSQKVAEGYQCQTGQIDDHGRVFGYVQPQGGHAWRAFVWHGGKLRRLEHLPGGRPYAVARAGNKAGTIVGWDDKSDYTHAVAWHDGVIENLSPGCCWDTEAHAIDEAGTIVGQGRERAGDDPRYFAMRFEGGQRISLGSEVVNPEGWDILSNAVGISNGIVVGYGYLESDDKVHGFMLVPN